MTSSNTANRVFPARNLPGRAEEWGRKIEEAISRLDGGITIMSSGMGNLERGMSGQFATSAQHEAQIAYAESLADRARVSADGKSTVWRSPEQPEGTDHAVGDTWFDESDGNKIYTWDGEKWEDVFLGFDALDQQIKDDIQSAYDNALDALDEAIEARESADGKSTIHYGNTAPAGTDHKVGDTWFDGSNDNEIHEWDGSAWVPVAIGVGALDQQIKDDIQTAFDNAFNALNEAIEARASADGKNTIHYGDTAPSGTDHVVGDTWFDGANGNRINEWNGTEWEPKGLDAEALASNVTDSIQDAKQSADQAVMEATGAGELAQRALEATGHSDNMIKNGSFFMGYDYWTVNEAGGELMIDGAGLTSDPVTLVGVRNLVEGPPVYVSEGLTLTSDLFIAKAGHTLHITYTGFFVSSVPGTQMVVSFPLSPAPDVVFPTGETGVEFEVPGAEGSDTFLEVKIIVPMADGESQYAIIGGVRLTDVTAFTEAREALDGLVVVGETVDGLNRTFTSVDTPALPSGQNFHNGDVWYKANASNLNQIVETRIWNGTSWVLKRLIADSVLVPSSVGNVLIKDGAVNARTIAAGAITAGSAIIEDGAITNAKIANATITNAKIANLDAAKITTGELDAARVKMDAAFVNKMVANKVLVSGENLIKNTDFVGEAWTRTNGATSVVFAPIDGPDGSPAVASAATTTVTYAAYYAGRQRDPQWAIPAREGEHFRASAWVYSPTTIAASTIGIGAIRYTEDGTRSASVQYRNPEIPANTWVRISQDLTLLATTRSFGIYAVVAAAHTDAVYFSDFSVVRKTSGELIVDGAITAGSAIIANGAIGTAQIANLAVDTAKIANSAITNAKIANLDAAKITSGTIDAGRIGANTISTGKLLVGDFENAVENGEATSGSAGWVATPTIVNDPLFPSGKAFSITGLGSYPSLHQERYIPVRPGDQWHLAVLTRTTGTTPTRNVTPRALFYTAPGVGVTGNQGGSATANPSANVAEVSATVTVPSGVAYMRLLLEYSGATGTTGLASSYRARRLNGGELIVDGAITANSAIIANGAIGSAKIASLAVTNAKIADGTIQNAKIANLDAAKISTGTLNANRIAANSITATKISGGDFAGKTFSGGIFTGSTFRTAASGARTVMDSGGISVFDSSGLLQTRLSGSIPTGMEVRNPYTNSMMPLATAAFGTQSVSKTATSGVITTNANPWQWTQFGFDSDLNIVHTAWTTSVEIRWGQVWVYNNIALGQFLVACRPTVNGNPIATGNGSTLYVSQQMAFPSSSEPVERRSANLNGSTIIKTVPGQTYTMRLQWCNGKFHSGSPNGRTSVANRYITVIPVMD